jgi:hypothetical protein
MDLNRERENSPAAGTAPTANDNVSQRQQSEMQRVCLIFILLLKIVFFPPSFRKMA